MGRKIVRQLSHLLAALRAAAAPDVKRGRKIPGYVKVEPIAPDSRRFLPVFAVPAGHSAAMAPTDTGGVLPNTSNGHYR